MDKILQKYLSAFKKLRIDRAHGLAPHKPLLLLSVLQGYQEGSILDQRIFITPELVAQFKSNWTSLVNTSHDCKFSLPFYHLTSDGFWKLVPKAGYENILLLRSSMRSFSNLNTAVEYALIELELLDLVLDKVSNRVLQQFLLDEYFPTTNNNYQVNSYPKHDILNAVENKILYEDPIEYRKEIEILLQHKDDEEIFIRGSLFKREIPKVYNNTCCISGMRIDAIMDVTMIDACHIVPFSESYNDTISNGIALCPNLHRAFDRGLIAVDDDFKVIVSSAFKENENKYGIKVFHGSRLILPLEHKHLPSKDNFAWHRQWRFKQ